MAGLLYALVLILMLVSMWKIYEKLGTEGWKAIIPIYNIIVLLQLLKWDLWKIILFFIPIVNIVFAILLYRDLAARFGKGIGFTIGILLLPVVFLPLLAFKGEVVSTEE